MVSLQNMLLTWLQKRLQCSVSIYIILTEAIIDMKVMLSAQAEKKILVLYGIHF
jgi:hypothetical protein